MDKLRSAHRISVIIGLAMMASLLVYAIFFKLYPCSSVWIRVQRV